MLTRLEGVKLVPFPKTSIKFDAHVHGVVLLLCWSAPLCVSGLGHCDECTTRWLTVSVGILATLHRSGGSPGAEHGHTLVHYPWNTVGLCGMTKNFVNLIVPYEFCTVVPHTCTRLVAQFLDLGIGAPQFLPLV